MAVRVWFWPTKATNVFFWQIGISNLPTSGRSASELASM
jgi:hypothetical protein